MKRGNEYLISTSRHLVERAAAQMGIHLFGWRRSRSTYPSSVIRRGTPAEIQQVLLGRTRGWDDAEFERRLSRARKVAEKLASEKMT